MDLTGCSTSQQFSCDRYLFLVLLRASFALFIMNIYIIYKFWPYTNSGLGFSLWILHLIQLLPVRCCCYLIIVTCVIYTHNLLNLHAQFIYLLIDLLVYLYVSVFLYLFMYLILFVFEL